MSNIYSLVAKNNVKLRIWNPSNTTEQIFYSDDDIKIDAKFSWNPANPNEVTEINFKLTNLDKKKYELCKVGRKVPNNTDFTDNARKCYNGEIGDFYFIYLNENPTANPNLELKVTIGKKEVLNLEKGNFVPILFKVNDKCPTPPNCNLDDGSPKTKDGTIIVSI